MAVSIQEIKGSSDSNPDNGLSARNKINSNFQNLANAILYLQGDETPVEDNNLACVYFVESYPLLESDLLDDSLRIQRAIDECVLNGGGIVCAKAGFTYNMKSTVNIPVKVIFDGQGATFVPQTTNTFKNNFMFSMNSINASGWDTGYNTELCEIRKSRFKNNNLVSNIKCIYCGATKAKIIDIYAYRMYGVVTRTDNYCDMLEIDTVQNFEQKGTGYGLYITFIGDGLKIENIHTPDSKAIYVTGCLGGKISRIINGDIYIDVCQGITMQDLHLETGTITIKNSRVSIMDVIQYAVFGNLKILKTAVDETNIVVNLKNYTFSYEKDVNTSYIGYDIEMDAGILNIENVYRQHFNSSNIGENQYYGIKVKYGTSECSDFNRYSGMLSHKSQIINGYIPNNLVYKLLGGIQYFLGINQLRNNGFYVAGTYHFALNVLVDKLRKIGYQDTQGNVSSSILDNQSVYFLIGGNDLKDNRNKTLRFYRGSSANTYNNYVDVPMISSILVQDKGNDICGYQWKSRTLGNRDELFFSYKTIYYDENVECYYNNYPTVGTWQKNDKVTNSDYYTGSPRSWRCTLSGTNGTLSGVTGSINSGTNLLTVNNALDLIVGNYINIAGVSGTKVIIAINETVLTLDSNADATVTNASVSFRNSIWISEGNL